LRKYIFMLIAVAGLVGLVASPLESLNASAEALDLCINMIIPTLFPFFVFSSLAVSLGLADILGKIFGQIMRPVFNVNGTCSAAFILGLISGFPVGAKTAISLYENNLCTKTEAERILSFSNNAGPAFVLGTVGIGIWNSNSVGWTLWLTQIIASIAVGFIFGKIWKKQDKDRENVIAVKNSRVVKFLPAITDAVKNSAMNLIYISSFIVFFAIIIRLLTVSGIIPLAAKILNSILPIKGLTVNDYENIISGIFEFTTGIRRIGNTAPYSQSLTLTAAILGWAGLSVHCQVLSFIYESGLSPIPYIAGKGLQTFFSAIIVFVISKYIPLEESISTFVSYTNTINQSKVNILHITSISAIIAVLLTIIIFFIHIQKGRKMKTSVFILKRKDRR